MNDITKIDIEELVVGPLATNCFLVSCKETKEALIIDPGGSPERIREAVTETGVKPVLIVLTHGHSDHMAEAAQLMDEYGIGLAMHEDDVTTMKKSVEDAPMWGLGSPAYPEPEKLLGEGDRIEFGKAWLEVLHTPGHTMGGISLYIKGALFAGDTLFARSIGRTDFYGGDMEAILNSIREKIFTLPGETVVYCGHGPSTTVEVEKRQNPFLNGMM